LYYNTEDTYTDLSQSVSTNLLL